jgi:hypothetical protein
VTNWLGLRFSVAIAQVGIAELKIRKQDWNAAFGINSKIRIHRLSGTEHSIVCTGFVRRIERSWSGEDTVDIRILDTNALLAWRYVMWPAGTTNRSDFSNKAAETIMTDLVYYNAGAGATIAGGRLLDGNYGFLNVRSSSGRGNTMSLGCAFKNLLEALQTIRNRGGGDFGIVDLGATFEFRWEPLWGEDKTSYVILSPELGNVSEIVYTEDYTDEATAVLVAGQGEQEQRSFGTATRDAAIAIEHFGDRRDIGDDSQLPQQATEVLLEKTPRPQLRLKVAQIPGCRYFEHYNIGDLVSCMLDGVRYTMYVQGAQVSVDASGAEDIEVEFEWRGS